MATLRDLLAAGMTEEEIAQYMAAEKAQPTLGALVQPPAYAEDVTSAAELAPDQIAPSPAYTPGTVTKLAPAASDAERLQRDTEFRSAANARRKELEQQNVPATTMEGMLNQIMKMAQKGYVTKSNDPAYSSVEYRNGMPIEQIMQTPQFKMLQALSPQFKQAAEIDRMKAEAEKERALATTGGRKATIEPKIIESGGKQYSVDLNVPGGKVTPLMMDGQQLAGKKGNELSASAQREVFKAEDIIAGSEAAKSLLSEAIDINNQAMGFPGAGVVATAGSALPKAIRPEMVDTTLNLDNLVKSSVLPQLKAIFGAAPTEGERKILLEVAGAVSQPAEVRAKIFQRASDAADMKIKLNGKRIATLGGQSPTPDGGSSSPAPQLGSAVAQIPTGAPQAKTMSMNDVMETSRKSGKSIDAVLAAARSKGYTIQGQ